MASVNVFLNKRQRFYNKKSGIIFRYKCDRLECDEEYICESARTFGEKFREHLKAPSPIYDHSNTTGHTTALDNFSIVEREDHNLMRLIKEAIYIRVHNPSLNTNRRVPATSHSGEGSEQHHRTKIKVKNIHQHIDPLPIPSATLATTSAIMKHSKLCGHSICHNGINICHHI